MDLGLRSDDRILILGASGWFGQELLDILPDQSTVMAVAGPSSGSVPGFDELAGFRPTIVANFAFLTKERLDSDGEGEFRRTNESLIERFSHCLDLASVRAGITVSSGAAVTQKSHPYGEMKAREEESALAQARGDQGVVVIRAYSVSGPRVRRPSDYAFSDLILQARTGAMTIASPGPVRRRYCAVVDALTVALRSATAGRTGLFDTGGPLVEMGGLAEAIRTEVNPDATISRVGGEDGPKGSGSDYFSDDRSWTDWCAESEVIPMDLQAQIRYTDTNLPPAPA